MKKLCNRVLPAGMINKELYIIFRAPHPAQLLNVLGKQCIHRILIRPNLDIQMDIYILKNIWDDFLP